MFSIQLLPEFQRGPSGERLGEIKIGDFTECFAYTLPESAQHDWIEQLHKIIEGELVVTLVHDPRFAWVVYREGDLCFVQQKLSQDSQFNDLVPRKIVNEDGERISEWSTTLDSIKNFLKDKSNCSA